MTAKKSSATVLSFDQVVAHRKNLWKLPLAERKEIPGLPKLRADVILTGVLIYEAVMEEFGFQGTPRQHARPALRRRDGLKDLRLMIYDLRFARQSARQS